MKIGQTPIHLAFSEQKTAEVKFLLNSSEENVEDENGLSHLHIACAVGHLEAVKRYLNGGTNIAASVKSIFYWHGETEKDATPKIIREDSTPLHVAVIFNHKNVIKFLLTARADVYAKDSMGFTPIHLIMNTQTKMIWQRDEQGYSLTNNELAQMLFRAAPDLRDSVNAAGLSHLHVAALANIGWAVDRLLRKGADIEQVISADIEQFPFLETWAGQTPLLVAKFNDKAVKSLLKAGANVYAKDLKGISALQHGLSNMSYISAQYFIRMVKRGTCEVQSCGMTPLHVALGTSNMKWAKKVLKNKVDVNVRLRAEGNIYDGATPLHIIIDKEAEYIEPNLRRLERFIKLLVSKGADLSIQWNGSTPLHLIYEFSNHDTFRIRQGFHAADTLLDGLQSYDSNPVNSYGFSHFHLACVQNNVVVAKKFLDSGTDIDQPTKFIAKDEQDDIGYTPLHYTMSHQSKEVAYVLLERGANVHAQDLNGNTPLHIAIKKKFVDLPLIETMLRFGVDINAKNTRGQTPLYCLLAYGGLTLERLEFFLNYGGLINILNATYKSREGIIGLAMLGAPPTELQSILERLALVSELKSAIESGFRMIHSMVAIDPNNNLTFDDYLQAIELFTGSDLNQQNPEGKTALHIAVSHCNIEALKVLLTLGADINVVDNQKKCAFLEKIVPVSRTNIEELRKVEVIAALACHVWKLRFTEIDVNESNLKCLLEAEKKISFVAVLKQSCHIELINANETEICQGIFVKDFLSELGAVAQYPRMWPDHRVIIKKFFTNITDLRQMFPELCALLALQYRKAIARMDLWQPAKEAIVLICQVHLPDLCLEAILRFFTNNEIDLLIQLAEDFM